MMKYLAAVLMALLGAACAYAAEVWSIAFKDKTQTAIAGDATGSGAPTVNSVTLSGATTEYKTTGSLGGNSTLFTPNTNVQMTASNDNNPNVGPWTGTIAFRAAGNQSISKITVNLFSFNASGDPQGNDTDRELKLSVALNGTTMSGIFMLKGKGSLNTTACEFTSESPIVLAAGETYSLSITAERTSEVLGCYFGMQSVTASFEVAKIVESTTFPRGYVAKLLPAGGTIYFCANVQKPILAAGTGAFSVGDAGIVLSADAGMDFNDCLESGKAYLLEVDFEDGTAVAMINPEAWIDAADAWSATGNVLNFADAPLARLIASTEAESLPYRLREAWTLDELFGASYAAGELKQGTALTGDAIFLYAADGITPIKFYNHATKGWTAVGVKAATAQAAKAPVHPHKPLRITRKKGADLLLNLLGEALPGDALIAVVKGTDVIASGDAFPQSLAASELEAEATLNAVTLAGIRFVFNDETQSWEAESGEPAESVSLEDGFETERSDDNPGHLRVRSVK